MQLSTQCRIATFLYSLLAAIVLCSFPLDAADETGYTIRTGVNEVRLAFAATDRQGHVIKTLRPSDVAVADNGSIIRHFRSFRPTSETPLDLVILLDASDSVASQLPSEVAEVQSFVERSTWGERDRVSILSFGGLRPQLLCARNCKAQGARLKLSNLRATGATPLYDALFEAAELLKESRDPEARRAMILFSDGVDTISMHSASDALRAAQNLQSAIYSVNSRSRKSAPDRGDAMLDFLAGSTGGLSFQPGQNVSEVLHKVLEDLQSGYVLTYELPRQSSGQHSVRILPVRDPRLQFRSRQAYDDTGNE
jgi:Ca-activated chloride channel family protein